MSAELALQAMAAMQQQIAVMQSRMDAHDQVSDQIHVCSARHQQSCSKASAVQDTDAGRQQWHGQTTTRTPMLGDNSGLGRPQTFSGDEAQFQRWSQEAESFFSGVFPDGARLLARARVRRWR